MGNKNEGVQQRTHGQVLRYLMNYHGEVDGLLLDNGICVRFAPEYGAAVVEALKPGTDISVEGRTHSKTSDFHSLKPHTFQILKTGETIRLKDLAKTPLQGEATPHHHEQQHFTGLFEGLLYNDNSDIDGMYLQDGSLVKIAPHEAKRLVTLSLVKGITKVEASGEGSLTTFGTVLRAEELKLDSLSFLAPHLAS